MEMNNAEDFACQLVRFIASPLIYDCFFSLLFSSLFFFSF